MRQELRATIGGVSIERHEGGALGRSPILPLPVLYTLD